MTKPVLFLLAAAFTVNASAQKIAFTDPVNTWNVLSSHFDDPFGHYARFKWGRDTTIAGFRYRYLAADNRQSIPLYNAWVREDSVAGKVYGRRDGLNPAGRGDSVERVLYDYNLVKGDTVRVDNGTFHSKHYVDHIDSTSLNGVMHKVWFLTEVWQSQSGSIEYVVIEGIGATRHPLFPLYPSVFENYERMNCFYRTGTGNPIPASVIKWRSVSFDNTCGLGIGPDGTDQNHFARIVPNPATGAVELLPGSGMGDGNLQIFDATGRTLAAHPVRSGERLRFSVAGFAPGMYYFALSETSSGHRRTGRFSVR